MTRVEDRGPRGILAGFGQGLRFALRRDRIRLPAWVLGTALFTAYCVSALRFAVPDESDLAAMTSLMSGPAGVVLIGPGFGFDHPTHANVFAGAYGLYVMLLAACMSILLAVRHTRGEEESERLELVRALPVSRHTPPAVATVMLLLANALTVLACWAVIAVSFDPLSSLLFALGVGMVGLVFGAVALVAAQLASHARTATGWAFVALGIAFAVRGAGDVLGSSGGSSALSWLSPLAWAQQTRPYVADRWWPLLLGAAAAAVLTALAAALQARRDLGAGLLPGREGRAHASPALAGPLSLALRLQRGGLAGWILAAALTGLAFGALAEEVGSSLGEIDDPLIVAALGGDPGRIVDGYLAVCLLFGVVLASCFGILAVQRLASEERSGRAELMLALPLGRTRWAASTALVATGGAAIVLLAAGLATGAAAAAAMGDPDRTPQLTGAGLAFLPAVAVLVGAALLGYALRPGLAGLAWAVAGYGFFVSMLGGPLQLPDAAQRLSVLDPVGRPPLDEVSAGPLIGLAAVAAGLIALALLLLRRRDLPA